jgi:type I restriction enzyme M protein
VLETKKNRDGTPGKTVDKGWACDLVPKDLLVQHNFAAEQAHLDQLATELESTIAAQTELEEEHSGEDAVFDSFYKINDAEVKARIWELTHRYMDNGSDELEILKQWRKFSMRVSDFRKRIRTLDAELDAKALAHYPVLTVDELKALIVNNKWMTILNEAVHRELDRVSQALTWRMKELADRYGHTMPQLAREVEELDKCVIKHLAKIGFSWA